MYLNPKEFMERLEKLLFASISLSLLATGCELKSRINELNLPFLEGVEKKEIEEKTIQINCGRGSIDSFKEKGWKIKSERKEEIVCTWKTKKATKGCNLEKDKGCKITVPDKKGNLLIYDLFREKPVMKVD